MTEEKNTVRNVDVGIVMGSDSDWPTMKKAKEVLGSFEISCESRVLSAHRTPDDAIAWASGGAERGMKAIIAGAGGAAHLPGVMAASTLLPVIGVPIANGPLNGFDALLAIVQMPGGIPVATVGVGRADNAALLAVHMMATTDERIREKLQAYRSSMRSRVLAADQRIQQS